MIKYADILHQKALRHLTDIEIKKMEHCIGYSSDRVYHRSGAAYFKPRRNHFCPGGTDCEIFAGLKNKGFADCGKDGKFYWLNHSGLNILSAVKEVFIYSDNACGNEIDMSYDVLEVLLDDEVYCGYGCWLPTSAKEIALRARLPYRSTLSTLHYLQDKCGYVEKSCYGGCNEDGYPFCTNGWILTKKWISENQEEYDKRQKEEYKRMDAIGKGQKKEWYE